MHLISESPKIAVLQPSEDSPLANHGHMEIAYEDNAEDRIFYVWDLMVIFYGLDAVIAACNAIS